MARLKFLAVLGYWPTIFGAVGLVVGRWEIVALPVVICVGAAVFLVFNNGWHGAGWGDGGIALNILIALASLAATVAGVSISRLAL